ERDQFFSGREFQRFFAQSAQSVIVRANPPEFTIIAVSDAYVKLSNVPREVMLGRNLFDIFPDNDTDPSGKLSASKAFHEVIATRKAVSLPVYRYDIFVPAEGKLMPFYWSNINEPLLSDDGTTVDYIVNTTTNITEQIQLEEAEKNARRSVEHVQQRINNIFMNAPVGMVMLSRDNYIIEYANQLMYRMWNKGTSEQIIGQSIFSVIRELEASGLRAAYDRVVNEAEPFYQVEVPVTYDRDGEVKPYFFNIHMEPVHNLDGEVTGLMILTHDVTESLASRREIEASEERLRMASEATGLGTYDVDLLRHEIVHSPELATIFGRPADQKVSWDEFINVIHPEDRGIREMAFQRALATGIYFYEARLLLPDNTVRWMRAKGKIIYDETNRPVRIIGTVIDTTDDKQEEMRKNDFLAIASHELKTPLTSLKLLLEIMGGSFTAAGAIPPGVLLQKANRQVNRMTSLIHDFLNLSRIESGKVDLDKRMADLNQLISHTVDEQRILLGAGSLEFFPGQIPELSFDRDKLVQVVENMVTNAIKYSGREPQITVRSILSDNEVVVSVEDRGIGIDASHLPRIFQRFYRVEQQQAKLFSGFGSRATASDKRFAFVEAKVLLNEIINEDDV
ncbi:MAG: PAS domain S-box protein, partial [Chitinophagaceae bacterium]